MEEEILNIEEFLEKIKKKKRRDIYLDYNIIIELQELKEKNAKLFKKYLNILSKHKIYYSYGHLEELSTHKWKDESLKKARIKFIEELTQNNEIIYEQYSNLLLAKFEKKKEDINNCLSRVQASSTYNEYQDNIFMSNHSHLQTDEIENVNNISTNNFFNNEIVAIKFQEYLNIVESEIPLHEIHNRLLLLEIHKIDKRSRGLFCKLIASDLIYEHKIIEDLKNKKLEVIRTKLKYFKYTERLMEILFNFLYRINFYKESGKKTVYRSKIFDVTHCIFATQMNYFITSDKRLFYKMKVIYNFLGIKTKIKLIKWNNN